MELDRVLIIGAGITGLSLAHEIRKQNAHVTVAEATSQAGGKMNTVAKNGFELDLGPVTCVLTPAVEQLFKELDLSDSLITPGPGAAKRYIYSEGRIHQIQPSFPKLFLNPILTNSGRFRILKDFFIRKQSNGDESIALFVKRHFGKEVLDKLFDPVLNGIYAGNCEELSVQSVLPFLHRMEQEHGSVINGLRKNKSSVNVGRKSIGISGGFKALIDALVKANKSAIRFDWRATKIDTAQNGFKVSFDGGDQTTETFSRIFITSPAFVAADLISELDLDLSRRLKAIPYAPVQQVYCETSNNHGLDGFGFLIPSSEKLSLLGAVQNSSLFPQKAPVEKSLFTLFCGGRRSYPFVASPEQAVSQFEKIIGCKVNVLYQQEWTDGIPQYVVGHSQFLSMAEQFEKKYQGLHLLGNYKDGVSVGDRIQVGQEAARQVNIR